LRAIAAKVLDPVFMSKLQVWSMYDKEMRDVMPKIANVNNLIQDHGGISNGVTTPYFPASVPIELVTVIHGDSDGVKSAETYI
jgi:hypothetical protein